MQGSGRNAAQLRLQIAHPVVQGPFGGGLSSVRLAATVSNLGGLGSFGAHMLAPDDIQRVTRELRAATARPFAVNLWVSDHDTGGLHLDEATLDKYWPLFEPWFRELGIPRPERMQRGHPSFDAQVEALIEAAPPVFSFVFGVPPPAVLQACRRRHIVTIGTATSIAEAQLLDAAGIDLIVATGSEAGGHRPSFLAPAEESLMGTFALVQLVAPRVSAPVIAAGGIADARGLRAAFALGAQAVQVGTAFLACEESGTTDLHRAALFSERSRRTVLTRAFTGRLARGLANHWTLELEPRARELPPFPITSWFVAQLRTAALTAGRDDLISLWSGQIAPNLQHRTADALMRALLEDPAAFDSVPTKETTP